ncbi:ATP-binding cassette sub-family C member 4-like [Diorhabda sublineata]|uniref:ATP-binding cassette sub-family C member 4-like n=1 Tax=Diorhabda sublineata TaxID=1163346 RepID=UPI0024E14EE8|nr:ATP-binding cassette sub-family C member 4-like [Diorhabda sublineata]
MLIDDDTIVWVTGYVSTLQQDIKNQLSIISGERVKHMAEIIYGIRIIKMYAWEIPFEKIMSKIRDCELQILSKLAYLRCFSTSTLFCSEIIAVFLTLTTNVLLGNKIESHAVFVVVLIFFSILQYTIYFLPEAIERYINFKSSIERIETFLTLEEKEEQLKIISCIKGSRKPGTVYVKDVSAKWAKQTVLQDLSLKIRNGSLCCIVGPPSSGKTSFLSLVLKEITPQCGRVEVVGSISYASQKPWLFQSTVKNNILFGLPYNRHKYREVTRICDLDVEYQKLPLGDRTLTSERRVSENSILKEKINIARTIYRDADIYIFDDCCVSIDSETEKFIFLECFNEYLKNKTRIFVTRKLYLAREASLVVVFNNGNICKKIDGDDLKEENFDFLNSEVSKEENLCTSPGWKQFLEKTELNMHEKEEEFTNIENKRKCYRTIADFLRTSEKKFIFEIVIVFMVITQLTANISDLLLLEWMNHSINETYFYQADNNYVQLNESSTIIILYHKLVHDIFHGISLNQEKSDINFESTILKSSRDDFYICFYAGFISICIIFTAVKTLLFHTLCMKASRGLHRKMFENILFSPIKFFENFPAGKILQRFSKDLNVINELSPKVFITLQMFAAVFGAFLLIAYAIPTMILPIILITILGYLLASCFLITNRGLQRLEKNSQVAVEYFLATSFYGVSNIRSAGAEQFITEVFESLLDQHTSVYSLILMTSEYICFYLDFFTVLFLAVVTFFNISVGMNNSHSGYIGLPITQAIILTELLHVGIRETIEVLGKLPSLERNLMYTKLITEKVDEATLIPKSWPYCGKIVCKNVYIKENDGRGSRLKNLNIAVKPVEKIAVVSRNSEEKWALVNCLYRLVKVEGLITLDDVDTSQISLNKLRSSVTIITQEPILFSSSVRFNLDPLECASDDILWRVLEEVGMKTSIQSLSQPIIDGGINFSYGQRQLLCLARAILRNTKVVIIDTSPNNLDPNTYSLMQKIIKEKFRNCTVITLANNLSSVMDTSRILVLEEGNEVGYAHANELLQNQESNFSKIVKEAGPAKEAILRKLAKDYFDLRNLGIEFKFSPK